MTSWQGIDIVREYHEDGTLPVNGEIFVFGSNLAGIHGAGAAKVARKKFGAEWGQSYGLSGRSFAIPTKNERLDTLRLLEVCMYVQDFINFTWQSDNADTRFFVTRVGCGLAGLKDKDVAPLFTYARNCSFAKEWKQYLEENV